MACEVLRTSAQFPISIAAPTLKHRFESLRRRPCEAPFGFNHATDYITASHKPIESVRATKPQITVSSRTYEGDVNRRSGIDFERSISLCVPHTTIVDGP